MIIWVEDETEEIPKELGIEAAVHIMFTQILLHFFSTANHFR